MGIQLSEEGGDYISVIIDGTKLLGIYKDLHDPKSVAVREAYHMVCGLLGITPQYTH